MAILVPLNLKETLCKIEEDYENSINRIRILGTQYRQKSE